MVDRLGGILRRHLEVGIGGVLVDTDNWVVVIFIALPPDSLVGVIADIPLGDRFACAQRVSHKNEDLVYETPDMRARAAMTF